MHCVPLRVLWILLMQSLYQSGLSHHLLAVTPVSLFLHFLDLAHGSHSCILQSTPPSDCFNAQCRQQLLHKLAPGATFSSFFFLLLFCRYLVSVISDVWMQNMHSHKESTRSDTGFSIDRDRAARCDNSASLTASWHRHIPAHDAALFTPYSNTEHLVTKCGETASYS